MADAVTTTQKKQRGYRIRLRIFVPADPHDMAATKKAIDFAETYSKLAADAPAGTVIESFQATPGQAGEKD